MRIEGSVCCACAQASSKGVCARAHASAHVHTCTSAYVHSSNTCIRAYLEYVIMGLPVWYADRRERVLRLRASKQQGCVCVRAGVPRLPLRSSCSCRRVHSGTRSRIGAARMQILRAHSWKCGRTVLVPSALREPARHMPAERDVVLEEVAQLIVVAKFFFFTRCKRILTFPYRSAAGL
jgi:hypothetical protein